MDTKNGTTTTEKCFGLENESPEYEFGFYDDDDDDENSAKPVDDSPLSDYYVPTERELRDENKDGLEIWVIALVVLGGVVGAVVFAPCGRATVRRCSIGNFGSFWFWWPPDASEPVVVESSPSANKDKFVASLLVDMRVRGGPVGRTLDDSLFESTTETEGSVTETDNSFTKNFDEFSLEHFDDIFPDNKSDTSDNNVDTQLNVRSDMPVSIMRKRIIPDSV